MRKIILIGECELNVLFRNDRPWRALPGGILLNSAAALGKPQRLMTLTTSTSPMTVIMVVDVVGVSPSGHTSGAPPVRKYDVPFVSEAATDHVGDIIVDFLTLHGVAIHSIDRFTEGHTSSVLTFSSDHGEVRHCV